MKNYKEINESMRTILIDWMISVQHSFNLRQNTLFFAINYLDRFLELKEIRSNKLQLAGTTTLFIASKYEEVHPPSITDFSYITAKSCSIPEIISMENLILKSLDYRLTVVTPNVLVKYLCILDGNIGISVKRLVDYFLELALFECKMLKYKSSVLSAAAVYSARKVLKLEPAWTPTLIKHTEYVEEEIKECGKEMHKLAQEIDNSSFNSLKGKYRTLYNLALSKVSF